MKTLFFGTSAFAVPSLKALADRSSVVGVVTQPDRPSGRGQKLSPSPVKEAALALGLHIYQPERLRAFAAEIAELGIELFALASYGKILPQALLDVAPRGALNVHPSLLPRYRGAAPIQAALLHGDRETGVSIMLMDAGMDTGELVLQERVAIEDEESYGDLHDRLAHYGGVLLGRAIDLAQAGPLPHTPQNGEPSVTTPIGKNDLLIDWSWSADHVVNTIRAFSPQPAARAELRGQTVKVLRAHAVGEISNDVLGVACGSGAIVIDELVAPNRGRESGAAFLLRERAKAATQ